MGGGGERGRWEKRCLGREDGREEDVEDKRGYRDKRNKVKMVSKFFHTFALPAPIPLSTTTTFCLLFPALHSFVFQTLLTCKMLHRHNPAGSV